MPIRYSPRLPLDSAALAVLLVAALGWLAWAYRGPLGADLPVDTPEAMLPSQGLHELEPLANQAGFFRWTTGAARLEPPNPGGSLALRLGLASGRDTATPVLVEVGGERLAFTLAPGLRRYQLLVPPQPGERVAVSIESPTINPDGRDLGVVVRQVGLFGGGMVPLVPTLGLLLASLGGYCLLRRAGLGPLGAAGLLLALQGAAALWQASGGWRYGFFGALLALAGAASLAAALIERFAPPLRPAPPPPLRLGRHDAMALSLALLLALACCLPWVAAPDPVGDLELSARRMWFMYERGLAESNTGGGDYMPLRIYILRLLAPLVPALGGSFFAPLPPPTLALIKLPSLLATLATVALIYRWSRRWRGPLGAGLIAALHALAAPVWINAAWWGQVDLLLTLPLLLALALFDRAGGLPSWLCWGLGLLIKPQAIILAPLMYVVTLRRHGSRGLALGGGLLAGLLIAAATPIALAGQGPGLYQAAVGSVGRFPSATVQAYNLWWLVTDGVPTSDLTEGPLGLSYRTIGALLLVAVALLTMLMLWRRSDGAARAEAAAVLALAFFVLPTQIHERYAFFALSFFALGIAADRRTLLPYIALMVSATLNILGALDGFWPAATAMIANSPLPTLAAWFHVLLLAWLLVWGLSRALRAGDGR
jgi:Gpi18-like mannosyltransferase